MVFYVDIHVQADPQMSLHDAHELSGAVKAAIRQAERRVQDIAGRVLEKMLGER